MAFNAGQILTAKDLNPPAGKLSLSANQTIATTTVETVALDTVDYDFRSFTDAANNQLVVPVDGVYAIKLVVRWANNSTGDRLARIVLNGVPYVQEVGKGVGTSVGGSTLGVSADAQLVSGDTLTAEVWQDTGASLDITTNFGGTKLSASLIRE